MQAQTECRARCKWPRNEAIPTVTPRTDELDRQTHRSDAGIGTSALAGLDLSGKTTYEVWSAFQHDEKIEPVVALRERPLLVHFTFRCYTHRPLTGPGGWV